MCACVCVCVCVSVGRELGVYVVGGEGVIVFKCYSVVSSAVEACIWVSFIKFCP